MKTLFSRLALGALALGLAACESTPTSIVQGPMTVRPPKAAAPVAPTGGIFQASNYRPMFEDRRARMVGDLLIITITEKTSAGKTASSSGSKSGSMEFAAPKLFSASTSTTTNAALSASSGGKFADSGAVSSANTFTGTIGVTVLDVLDNGNLVVTGEKQVSLDKSVEYIRFSGVVNPDTIVGGNTVPSTSVADARVEYRTSSRIDKAEVTSMLSRFFLSVLPL